MILITIGLIISGIYLYWRYTLIKHIPANKSTFPLGHGRYFSLVPSVTPLHIRLMEVFSGASLLFKNEGMFYIRFFHIDVVLLTKAEVVKDLIGTKENGIKTSFMDPMKVAFGEGLITTRTNDRWKFLRKFVNHHLGIKSLMNYQEIMAAHSTILCKKLFEIPFDTAFDIYPHIIRCAFNFAVETFTGNIPGKYDHATDLFERTEEIFAQCAINPLARLDVQYLKYFVGRENHEIGKEYRKYFADMLDKRRREISSVSSESHILRKNDASHENQMTLLDSFILEQQTNETLKDKDIVDELTTLITAYDTTATALIWSIYLIGYYPEVQKKIHQELDEIFGTDTERDITSDDLSKMKYLHCVYKESLRIYPPVPVFGRKLEKNTEIGGRMIPKGTDVVVLTCEVQKDPTYFENPQEFLPERFSTDNKNFIHPCAFIPFSYGPRNCVGISYALKAGVTMLGSILSNFSIKSLEHRDKIQVKWGITGKPQTDIMVKLLPRNQN